MPGEPPENTSVRRLRAAATRMNASGVPNTDGVELAADFLFVDRRTGGVNFGASRAPGYLQGIMSAWTTGAGTPHWSVPRIVAVRGDRSALVVLAIDYEDGVRQEMLHLEHLDSSLRTRRAVQFDLDDVTAATEELDRLATDDASPDP